MMPRETNSPDYFGTKKKSIERLSHMFWFAEGEKIFRFPVVFKDGTWVPLDMEKMPRVTEGTRAFMEIRKRDILTTPRFVDEMVKPERKLFLPKGSKLWARVNNGRGEEIPEEAPDLGRTKSRSRYLPVALQLESDCYITLKFYERITLKPCRCTIPSLNRKADSISHAFSLISRHHERSRSTSSGSVYKAVFVEEGGHCRSLERVRNFLKDEFYRERQSEYWQSVEENTNK